MTVRRTVSNELTTQESQRRDESSNYFIAVIIEITTEFMNMPHILCLRMPSGKSPVSSGQLDKSLVLGWHIAN